jgi:hypothetical protein
LSLLPPLLLLLLLLLLLWLGVAGATPNNVCSCAMSTAAMCWYCSAVSSTAAAAAAGAQVPSLGLHLLLPSLLLLLLGLSTMRPPHDGTTKLLLSLTLPLGPSSNSGLCCLGGIYTTNCSTWGCTTAAAAALLTTAAVPNRLDWPALLLLLLMPS